MKVLLEQYKNNELSESEVDELWQQLIQVKMDKALKQEWASQLKEVHQVQRSHRNSVRTLPIWWRKAIAVAAMFLVVFAISYLQIYSTLPNYKRLAIKYIQLTNIVTPSTLMGSENVDELWGRVKEAMETKNYNRAGQHLEEIVMMGKATGKTYYYLGICYLHQQQPNYPKAILQFEKVVDFNKAQSENQYTHETVWYLGLAYLGNGQEEQARQQFKQVIEEGEWKVAQAKTLLGEMN